MHVGSHPSAGETVILNETAKDPQRGIVVAGAEFVLEDWYDYMDGRGIYGRSWMTDRTFATHWYAMRREANDLPLDDEVVYGHIGPYGHLVHVSELPTT
jgi:hypothetical protein